MEQQNFTPPNEGNQPSSGGRGKGLAVASLVLGIVSLFLGIIPGVVGIVLAVIAKKNGFTGGMATAGLVLSIIGVVSGIVILIACGGMMWMLQMAY